MNRLTRAFVLLAAGVALIAAVPLGPATAAGGSPVITVSAADPKHPEIVKATVTSSDSVVVSVSLRMDAGDPDPGTDWLFGKEGSSTLWVSEPLLLRLGTWSGTITAEDADGDTSTARVTIDYQKVPRVVSFTLPTDPLSFDHPTLTATGKIVAYDPRNGQTAGADGVVSLSLTSPGGGVNSAAVHTASDGTFTVSAAPGEFNPGDTLSVVLVWSGDTGTRNALTNGGGPYNAVIGTAGVVATESFASRVRLDATKLTYKVPTPEPLSGVVERQVGADWLPVENVNVLVDLPLVKDVPPLTVRTGEDGTFSTAITTKFDLAELAVLIDDPVLGAFLRAAGDTPVQALASVHVVRQTALTWSSRAVTAKSQVRVAGRAATTVEGNPAGIRVYLQDSINGKTGWRNVGYLTVGSTGTYDKTFALENTYVSRYYRLYFAGNADLQPAATGAYRLSRHASRITGAKVSPTTVVKGRSVKVSGVLQKESGGKWVNLGKNKVIKYYFQAKGSTKNVYLGSSKTTSSGSFAKSFKATKAGYWFAVWRTTSSSYVDAYGAKKYVGLKSAASATWIPVPRPV